MQFKHEALEDQVLNVPAVKAVCPACNGHGTHVRRDIDDSRLVDSMREDGDYEGLEAYRRGAYDQKCSTCHGRNVVDEIDWGYIEDNHPAEFKAICEWNQDMRDYHAECAAERACGA